MDIMLSAEQEALCRMMEETTQHMFVTGRAGTGKSLLLRYFREQTHKKVVVAAPTGIAALNVSGQTIHSLFRLPPRLHRPGTLDPNARVCTLLKRIETLIIDEVSMVRADLLDAIDERLREACKKDLPFGGVQVIMIGDVYQLPPVIEDGLVDYFEAVHKGHFFFNALVWNQATFKIYELTQVFRQRDPVFRGLLNAVRDGTIVESQIEELNARHGVAVPDGTVTLAPTNAQVTNINQQRLDQLPGKVKTYQAAVIGEMKRSVFPTEEFLQLKEGAQVVLLRNDKDGRWVNGSVGMVEGLFDKYIEVRVGGILYSLERETWEEIAYTYDQEEQKVEARVVSSFCQYPVRLAWAMTIHKSQGQTYESLQLDLTTATFAAGQLYVALSRCTSLEGLYLKVPIKAAHVLVEPKVTAFMMQRELIIDDQADVATCIHHDEIVIETEILSGNIQLHHDKIIHVEELYHDVNDEELTRLLAVIDEELSAVPTAESNRPANRMREKKGRTKKERKSTKGRKTKSGVVREPLQLSLDIRTIIALNAMGVNRSQLFEDLLHQYKPFQEVYAALHPGELDHDENEEE